MDEYETARSAWPAVMIPVDQFLAYLRERPPDPEALNPQRLQELYLTCGCARGDREALAMFRERYVMSLADGLGRSRWPAALVEEVLQQIQVTLLVATPDAPPRITQYRGAGSLLTWVKVMVIRELRKRSVKGAPAREEELGTIVDRLWGRDDPEHDALLRRHRPEIQAIVRDAVQSMAPDDRMLLKLGVVDGVSTVKLGPRIGLNQSTVWRKLDRIKRDLNQAIHDHLKKRFNLSTRDLESMMNALRSSLDLSISQIFGKGEEDDSDENA